MRKSQLGNGEFIHSSMVFGAWDHGLGPGTTGTASIATCPLDNINTTGGRRQTGIGGFMVVSLTTFLAGVHEKGQAHYATLVSTSTFSYQW